MYKVGYTIYGLKIVSIVWSEAILEDIVSKRWKYRSPMYCVEYDRRSNIGVKSSSPIHKYKNYALLLEYQLNNLISKRKYHCRNIKDIFCELKIKFNAG